MIVCVGRSPQESAGARSQHDHLLEPTRDSIQDPARKRRQRGAGPHRDVLFYQVGHHPI